MIAKYTSEKFAQSIGISVDIPVLGYNNISVSLTDKGYLITNIFETGKAFYIGEEKVQEFIEYVINNYEGYRIVYVDKDGNEINLIDVIKANNVDIIEELHTKDNIESINKFLNILTPREKEIIIKRFGLFNTDELTQKEIAEELNISRSYVSRIEKRAISKVYREFKKKKKEF